MPKKIIKRSVIIPILLLVYLAVMAVMGWPAYRTGQTPALQYFGVIVLTVAIIGLLHLNLKKREKRREANHR